MPEQIPWAGLGQATLGPRLVYRTHLGLQAHADSRDILATMPPDSVDLVVTSPPFPLLRRKQYSSNPRAAYEDQTAYAAWLVTFGHAVLRVLKPTGSFVIDLGGAYQPGRPVRSLHPFRALIALSDECGFRLAEECWWENTAKLPSPIEWVNKRKIRLKDSVDALWWLSKTDAPKADVRKVLTPYSDRMRALLRHPEGFASTRPRPSGHLVESGFARDNGGAIPSNILHIPNTSSNDWYLRSLEALGRKRHPARFPARLPEFFIALCTDPGDLVLDIFSGSNVTGRVAETMGRSWVSIELERPHAVNSAVRFMEGRSEADVRGELERMEAGETVAFGNRASAR
jgi:site-specific DNA-methyltransferase (cytosine-N4-specific)